MTDPESKNEDDEAWKVLFEGLVQDDEKCTIKISDLEEAVEGINSKDLRADYNLQDFQLRR